MQAVGGQSRAMDPDEMRELETAIRTTMVQISPPGTVEPVVNRRAGSTLSPPRMPPRTTSLHEEPMPTASPPKYPDLVPKNAAVNLATAAAMVAGGDDDGDDDDDDAYLEIAPDADADGQWSGARASQIADDTLTSEASGSTFAATPGGPVRPAPVANQPIVVAMVDPAPQEDPPRGVAAWLLDFVRLVTLFGAVLVLSSAPFTLFELGRFQCRTHLAGIDSEGVGEIDHEYAIVSICATFSVLIFAVATIPNKPTLKLGVVTLITGIFPIIWVPLMFGMSASVNCPDSALLFSTDSANLVLPSGETAVTTDVTTLDESTRLMTIGIGLMGCGSTLLALFLAFTTKARPRANSMVLIFGPCIYLGGGISLVLHNNFDSGTWSNDPSNTAIAEDVCTQSSSAVFDDSQSNFDTLEMALLVAVSAAGAALLGRVFEALLVRPAGGTKFMAACAGLFGLTHLLFSLILTRLVYFSTNPVCIHATLADDKKAAWSFFVIGFACASVAFFTVAATGGAGRKAPQKDGQKDGEFVWDDFKMGGAVIDDGTAPGKSKRDSAAYNNVAEGTPGHANAVLNEGPDENVSKMIKSMPCRDTTPTTPFETIITGEARSDASIRTSTLAPKEEDTHAAGNEPAAISFEV